VKAKLRFLAFRGKEYWHFIGFKQGCQWGKYEVLARAIENRWRYQDFVYRLSLQGCSSFGALKSIVVDDV
jgi:hypothetical protein